MPAFVRYLAPLVAFLALAALLYKGLGIDPKRVPSHRSFFNSGITLNTRLAVMLFTTVTNLLILQPGTDCIRK